jgi:hypothetical protein
MACSRVVNGKFTRVYGMITSVVWCVHKAVWHVHERSTADPTVGNNDRTYTLA